MLFSRSLALCPRTRAAKKHAKVLLFSDMSNFFRLKVTLFLHFLPEKLKLLNRLCKTTPIFAPNSLFYQSLTNLFNSAYLILKIRDLYTKTPFIISLSAAGSSYLPSVERSALPYDSSVWGLRKFAICAGEECPMDIR